MSKYKINKLILKIKKPLLLLLFIAFVSFDVVYASVVTDNDGSALITKAEFDSLKNNFQSQLDTYNTSIDSKIDIAIASYLAGIKVEKRFDQISLINQLKTYSFARTFNYFGKESNVGDYYKYWSWYSLTFGLDRVNKADAGQFGIGLRGGTNVVNPVEKITGTIKSNYVICSKSSYNNSKYVPSYGVESYNYYYFLVMGSGYGGAASSPYNGVDKTYSGNMGTKTTFGTNFTNSMFGFSGLSNQNLGLAYSAFPMDIAWSNYDDKVLPGTIIDSSKNCYFIMDDEILNIGGEDGSFDATDMRENLYWTEGSNRQGGTGTITLNLSKYKRKYSTVKYISFIIDSVSQVASEEVYYYSGLPLFNASEEGEVTLKIKPTNSLNQNTTIAILDKQFGNVAVGSGGMGVPDAECTFTDWDMVSGTEYEIKFKVKKGKTYWIKACPSGTNSRTTFETSKIEVLKKD